MVPIWSDPNDSVGTAEYAVSEDGIKWKRLVMNARTGQNHWPILHRQSPGLAHRESSLTRGIESGPTFQAALSGQAEARFAVAAFLQGKTIALRFYLNHAKLYSFEAITDRPR